MHFLPLLFLASFSTASPVPDDSSDLSSLSGFEEVNSDAQNLIYPIPIDSYNGPGFRVLNSLDEPANSNNIVLCSRDPADINNKNEPSDQSKIAQLPANSCPANTNTNPSGNRLDHQKPRRDNIKCPQTKKGEPNYHQLCCWDEHNNRSPSLRPRGLSYHSSDREIFKRAGAQRTNCDIFYWNTCPYEDLYACCLEWNSETGRGTECVPGADLPDEPGEGPDHN